jgi:hypothetical protein
MNGIAATQPMAAGVISYSRFIMLEQLLILLLASSYARNKPFY